MRNDFEKDARLDFSETEWNGLVVAGDAAAAVSFAANSIVLFIHGFMLWCRPVVVARLSLRMIVLSCLFNMVYCACQLVTDGIDSTNFSCRILAYVLIVSDTMACMCLAVVGLNLVMIFVLRVSRSIKLELFYYGIIGVSGFLVAIVPILINKRREPRENASCWYHYYFDGRLNAGFNWMWYYAWLMFSSVFAAICAITSLAFVIQKQYSFVGTLDMFSFRDKTQTSRINKLKQYSKSNTDVFKKIARRCILYPLVPLISKSWGVAIVITAYKDTWIPYPVFVLDRIFTCLLGFLVSCIYYSDPAILSVFKEGMDSLKKRYVYDYFTVIYQPGLDPIVKPQGKYPQQIKVVENQRNKTDPTTSATHYANSSSLNRDSTTVESIIQPQDHFFYPHSYDPRRPSVSFSPDIPSIEVYKDTRSSRRYSVISVTSTSGRTFLPNEVSQDNTDTSKASCFDRKISHKVPMHRIQNDTRVGSHHVSLITKQDFRNTGEIVETLVPYKYPTGARWMHWMMVKIFRVSMDKYIQAEQERLAQVKPARVFRDFTDGSNPSSPVLSATSNLPTSHSPKLTIDTTFSNTSRDSVESIPMRGRAYSTDVPRSHVYEEQALYPLRRVSTVNLGSMYRGKYQDANVYRPRRRSSTQQHKRVASSTSSSSKAPMGLVKILSRRGSLSNLSKSWTKLTRSPKKSAAAPTPPMSPILSLSKNTIPMETLQLSSSPVPDHEPTETSPTIPFPGALFPRPVSLQKKLSIAKRVNRSNEISTSQEIPEERKKIHRLSVFGHQDAVLTPTFLQSDSPDISREQESLISDIIQPGSDQYAQTVQRESQSKDHYEGLSEGHTTIDFITSWSEQEDDQDDDTRVMVYSEVWDIEEQFRNQVQLAEDMQHV